MRTSRLIIIAIILLSFAIGIVFYPQMPEKMASHWNYKGEVDGYITKFWGSFLMPFILVGVTLLFLLIPKIDPLKANIQKFRKHYDGFIIVFLLFMLFIHLQMILWNLGIKISPNVFLPIGTGALFFYAGILLENAKSNWFIGIRTPWTLSSEKVWEKTHRIASKLFKISGVIAVVGVLFRDYSIFFVLIPIFLTTIYSTVYSYLEYKKESRS